MSGGEREWLRAVAPTAADPTAEELLGRVARGDEAAFAALYDQFAPLVFGLARAVLRDAAHAEEVTQEVLVEVWRSATRYDAARGGARAWVLTMAHRRAVDRVRSEQATRVRDDRAAARDAVGEHDEVAETAQVHLEQEQVRRCVQSLSGLQKEAVTMAYWSGYTHREVSQLLEVPLGTVKARIRDGMIRLRDCMGVEA
jgi:RNA polymerase sigma-70 factor (ECF subfamily)